jgi:crossover junction endodeoxyribonuclease RuvC
MSKEQIVVGIDPGKNGAIAILPAKGFIPDGPWMMPVSTFGQREHVCPHGLLKIFEHLNAEYEVLNVAIENVQPWPKESALSGFSIGRGLGAMLGLLTALRISHSIIPVREWKAEILRGTTKDKDAAIAFVSQRYPLINLTPPPKRKPHDGIADAVCLAEYSRRQVFGAKESAA